MGLKEQYSVIEDLFLHEDENWFLGLRINDKSSYYSITPGGFPRKIEQKKFLAKQLLVADSSLFEVYDSSIYSPETSPAWSWKEYELCLQNKRMREIKGRLTGLTSKIMEMANSNEVSWQMIRLKEEWQKLNRELAIIEAEPLPALIGPTGLYERHAGLFTETRDQAFTLIDSLSSSSDLAGSDLRNKLLQIKDQWEEYEIHIDGLKSSGKLTKQLLGMFHKSILIHQDLWRSILEEKES